MLYQRSEAELRAFLARHIELLEPGMDLIQEEYALSNPWGAAGRVDLLARDTDGGLTIVELKRSESTARQALHELHKYIALILRQSGLGPADVRCLLVSTSWRELLVPFSGSPGMSVGMMAGVRAMNVVGRKGWQRHVDRADEQAIAPWHPV